MENIALTNGGPMYCLMSALWILRKVIFINNFLNKPGLITVALENSGGWTTTLDMNL